MRICVLAHSNFWSDARISREAQSLANRGDEVDVFCLRESFEERRETIGTLRIRRLLKYRRPTTPAGMLGELAFFFLVSFAWLTVAYIRRRYDVIHVHTVPDFLVFAALLPKLCGARVILDMHEIMPELYVRKFRVPEGHPIIRLIRVVERLSVAFADHVIIASPFFREKIAARTSYSDKITTIVNLPDPAYFERRGRATQQSDGVFKLIYPGTLSELHGVDIAIRAVYKALSEHDIPLAFHIYGTGAERPNLQALVNQLGLAETVFFHSELPLDKLYDLLPTMDAGLIPKRGGTFAEEAMSTKLFEYAASGLPAIVSRTKSDTYYFDDTAALFFEPENVDQLAEAIVRLYRDRDFRHSLARNSKSVFERVNWLTLKPQFYAVFDDRPGIAN